MKIEPESPFDIDTIEEITIAAFGRKDEANLINNLRDNKNFIEDLSLVANDDGEIVGHILFFPVVIKEGSKKHSILALAPMSVLPKFQNKGIGTKLIEEGFKIAKKLGYTSIVVLGHEKYYPKFGFELAKNFNILPPVKAWEKSFFVKELVKGSLAKVSGTVEYPKEFKS